MTWNGNLVVDMDSHVYEEADVSYRDYMDPEFREPYERLCTAIARQRAAGQPYSLFMSRHAIMEPADELRPLGMQDTFGLVPERRPLNVEGAETARREPIRREVNFDAVPRLEDMDRAQIDLSVIFPTHASSYCALRDVGFESALYRAYHRFISSFCAQGKGRLHWVYLPNLRDIRASVEELRHWAERDERLVGVYLTPVCPDGRLLDNPDLHPLYQCAQDLDLPLFVHPGVLRSPLTPGAAELDNAGFIIRSVYQPWAGMTALSALIGGGVFDRFPTLRIAEMEMYAGWLPFLIERLDDSYRSRPHLVPFLERFPREVVDSGRYFHAVDTGEQYVEFCIEELGEDIWLFSTDYPHTGSPWPNGVPEVMERPGLTDSARRKLLAENALRLCPRLSVPSDVVVSLK
jgi:predicted TIM-barrel fold metal-dependent hydrolase